LSNDRGLLYDILNDDFEPAWTLRHFVLASTIFLNRKSTGDRSGEKYQIGSSGTITRSGPDIPEQKNNLVEFFCYLPFVESIRQQKVSQRYAVLRF
jgi:hypothetical protein